MKTKIKARIPCSFISKTTIMVNKRETMYFIISISDKRLSSFFVSLNLSFLFYLYLLFSLPFSFKFCRIWAERAYFFWRHIWGNFLSSFRHFWAEHFFQLGGGGGARAPSAPPPLRTPLEYSLFHWKPAEKMSLSWKAPVYLRKSSRKSSVLNNVK